MSSRQVGAVGDGVEDAGQVGNIDQLHPRLSAGNDRGKARLHRLEKFQHTGIAGSVNDRRTHHAPGTSYNAGNSPFPFEFRFAVPRRGRGKIGLLNWNAAAGRSCGGLRRDVHEHRRGADVRRRLGDRLRAGRIDVQVFRQCSRLDETCDVQHGVTTFHRSAIRCDVVKVPLDGCRRLRKQTRLVEPADERANLPTLFDEEPGGVAADEPCRTGDEEGFQRASRFGVADKSAVDRYTCCNVLVRRLRWTFPARGPKVNWRRYLGLAQVR